jgi:hypothetical protein
VIVYDRLIGLLDAKECPLPRLLRLPRLPRLESITIKGDMR